MSKTIRCIVAAVNASGEPDLYFVKVTCTEAQYDNGYCYGAARAKADDEGYEPCLAYDENDAAGKAMLPLFVWDTADVVDITEYPEYQ